MTAQPGFCQYCGAKLVWANQSFCSKCGASLAASAAVPPPPAPPPAEAPATVAVETSSPPPTPPLPPPAPTIYEPPAPQPVAAAGPPPPPPPPAPAEVPAAAAAEAPLLTLTPPPPAPTDVAYNMSAEVSAETPTPPPVATGVGLEPAQLGSTPTRGSRRTGLAVGAVVLLAAAAGLFFVATGHGGGAAQPTSLPAGTIHGKLVTDSGSGAGAKHLQLVVVNSLSGDTANMTVTSHQVTTDKTGAFDFESIPPGKYAILDTSVSFPLGGDIPSIGQMVLRDAAGSMLTFDLGSTQGLDLGTVKVPAGGSS